MSRKVDRLSDQIRQAIRDNDKTCYQIWKETGIAEASLSRFMTGKGGLSMNAIDRLGECLELDITTRRKSSIRKGS